MPNKEYHFVSVCKRDQPLRTNHRQRFLMHVASCYTCRIKLPRSIMEELQPELSQLIRRHIMSKDGTPYEMQKAQFDTLIEQSLPFRELIKLVQRLGKRFHDFGEQAKKEKPRPIPFGPPDDIPATMRAGYRSPPESKEPSRESKAKGIPNLDSPEQLKVMEAYLVNQRKKFEGGENVSLPSYLKEVKETVKAAREIIDEFKGKNTKGTVAEGATNLSPMDIFQAISQLVKAIEDRISGIYERQVDRITNIYARNEERLYELMMASPSKKK